ncbi:DUF317 domain-containing protein [Streptomyces yokosukanensis]|uniref:DUF317 domain-containing protein n=1 Tax=Streptomyces yokosukanensis TaxID=67386 RepID=UPI001FC9014B|nr:DUF317 domain-containing protein [Streptomyces yokosukanensis]
MPPHDDAHPLDGDVYVFPRYLAAGTATGDPALAPLLALGWDLEHDDLGNVYIHAPDRKVRLGYLPEGEDDGLWRINAYRDPFGPPAWGVCLNDSCPTEFATAFTTALAEAYQQSPDAYLARPVSGSSFFTAGPGAPVTVTVANTKTAATPKPAGEPTGTPPVPTDKPTVSGGSKPNPMASGTPDTESSLVPSPDPAQSAAPKTPAGSLAHTGADATPWILGRAGFLLAGGICTLVAARRCTKPKPEQSESADTN